MIAKLTESPEAIFYPESDGEPMAENTLQFDWIALLAGELREMYDERDDVFVAGDLFWYPIEGDADTKQAPDILTVFGRPPGYRSSYLQWVEEGVAPQVVFEIRSPSNTDVKLEEKFDFYQRHGVDEYYLIDPFAQTVKGWKRQRGRLVAIRKMNGWVSPRLQICFEMKDGELNVFTPDGRKFVQREERVRELRQEAERREIELRERAEHAERDKLVAERDKLTAERDKLAAERDKLAAIKRAEDLAAKLREMGIDPNSI